MKAIQTKTEAKPAKKNGPFFKKGPGQGFFKPAHPGIQTKLNVGEVGDAYEKEADSTADKVVKRLGAAAGGDKAADGGAAGSSGGVVSGGAVATGIHRKPIFESEGDGSDTVQRKSTDGGHAASPATATPRTASSSVESSLRSSKGGGAPLPAKTRQQMESSFGADFSGVRVHDGSAARQMSKDLNAQAFTHGKDIYFNEGKYDTSSTGGKHLLAHELTHVVQQTGGKTAGNRPVQRKIASAGVPGNRAAPGPGAAVASGPINRSFASIDMINSTDLPIQKEGDGTDAAVTTTDNNELAKYANPKGKIAYDKNGYHLVLTDFALKAYAGVDGPKVPENMESSGVARNTKQGAVWEKKVEEKQEGLKESLLALTKNGEGKKNPDETQEYILTIKAGANTSKSQVVGTVPALIKLLKTPFWDKSGNPVLHQIEHIIDWQVMGDGADNLEGNLILLDAKTNGQQGQVVKKAIKEEKNKVLTALRSTPLAKDIVDRAAGNTLQFQNAGAKKNTVNAKSTIQVPELTKATENPIISDKAIQLKIEEIPAGSCVIYTAYSEVGYIVPYNFSNKKIKIGGDPKKNAITDITQLQVIYTKSKVVKGGDKKLPLKFETLAKKDHFKLIDDNYAGSLTNQLKLVGMSPIQFDQQVDVSPLTGLTAEGKVISDIPFLKDADIGFSMEGGDFSVSATITSDVLKGKLPKPLDVDYSSLTITASTEEALAAEGEIGFSIKNVGKGMLSAKAGTDGFGLAGKFTFDNSKSFKKAEISFSYSRPSGEGEGKWEGAGELAFEKDVIPGVKSGDIKIGYANNVLSGAGTFETTLPKMDKVDVTAQFDAAGNFSITGKTGLKGVPGIKSSEITVTVTRQDSDYSLAMAGTAVPDLPNIPGLGASLTVSYNKGVFILEGKADYTKDKLEGSVTVGVTNAVVDENGVASKDTPDDKLKIYGNGSITLHLLKGVDATLQGAVDAAGEMFIWGNVDVQATPFDPVDIDKQIFKLQTSIPLAGIPFASINLDLGTGARFYFHWDPLTIKLHATLERTNIKDMDKAGGELTASLNSHAKAGFEVSVTAGVSVTVAIIKLGAHITGAVALELNADMGAEAKAKWDMQKGLQLEEAEAFIKGVPSVIFTLSGDITADVDLWLTSYQVYKKELGSVKRQLDLSQFAFGVTVPLKIDENGKVQGIDFDKLKITPSLDEKAGSNISDQVLNGDDRKIKEQKEKEAKDKIRNKVIQKLQAKKADGDDDDLREYASDLKDDMKSDAPEELAGYVDQVINDELRNLEKKPEPSPAPPPEPPDPNGGAGLNS